MNSEGKQIYLKEKITGGDQFEFSIANASKGLLIYSFQSVQEMFAGKIVY